MKTNKKLPYRSAAVVLWLVWAFLLLGGLSGRVTERLGLSSIETELKAGSSLALVTFAWLTFAFSQFPTRSVAGLIAVGMTLGCFGDASPLLGRVWPDPQRTLVNMVLFGFGHLAYIRSCVLLGQRENQESRATLWYGSLTVWLVIGGVAWYFAAYTGTRNSGMRVPALAYTLLLSATVGATFGYAIWNRQYVSVAIGAILFLTSDILLAVWIFHDFVYQPFDLVWLTYGVGQMLIVFGTSSYIQVSGLGRPDL